MPQTTTDQKIEALQVQMDDRMQALAEENLRLKRSARRYARWSTILVAVACVGVLSYAWAIDPLTDTGTTAPSAAGEVKTEFADGAVVSAGEFSSNFENLSAKTNELVTEVNTNTGNIRNTPYGEGNSTVATLSTTHTALTSVNLPGGGDWLCHYNLQVANTLSAEANFDAIASLSTTLSSTTGDKLESNGRELVLGTTFSGPEYISVGSYALFDGLTTATTIYLKGSSSLNGVVTIQSADVLCTELVQP